MNSPSELSFLPDDYLDRKAQRRTNTICAVLFMVVMVAIGAAFTITERSLKEIQKQHVAIDQDYTEAAKRIEQVQKMQDKQRKMAHQAELTAALLEKVPRTFVLAEITNALPSGVSLTDFVMESKVRQEVVSRPVGQTSFQRKADDATRAKNAPKPEEQIKKFDVNMKLTGLAHNDVQVAQLITRMNASKLFKEVNLLISETFEIEKEQFRKFQIELTLRPDASVEKQKDEPKTAAVEIK